MDALKNIPLVVVMLSIAAAIAVVRFGYMAKIANSQLPAAPKNPWGYLTYNGPAPGAAMLNTPYLPDGNAAVAPGYGGGWETA